MIAVVNGKTTLPRLESDGRMTVILSGNHFQQNCVIALLHYCIIAFIN